MTDKKTVFATGLVYSTLPDVLKPTLKSGLFTSLIIPVKLKSIRSLIISPGSVSGNAFCHAARFQSVEVVTIPPLFVSTIHELALQAV